MKDSKWLSVFTSLLIAVFFLTASVAVPILCRGWYYCQAASLDLSEKTGFSTETIHGAFDGIMNYLINDAPFNVGGLRWSEYGRSHFADCKWLFRLDFFLLAGSALGLLALSLVRFRGLVPYRFLDRSPSFWALMGTLSILLILGVWAVADFNSLFAAFHALLFPGKTNWIFDAETDPIILLLPEAFWARTAALVGGLTLGGEILAVLAGMAWRYTHTPKNIYEMAKKL